MHDWATRVASAAVDGASSLLGTVRGATVAWIRGGDVSLIAVLVGVSLVLLVLIVVPKRRRY